MGVISVIWIFKSINEATSCVPGTRYFKGILLLVCVCVHFFCPG